MNSEWKKTAMQRIKLTARDVVYTSVRPMSDHPLLSRAYKEKSLFEEAGSAMSKHELQRIGPLFLQQFSLLLFIVIIVFLIDIDLGYRFRSDNR
jgi:hypothetical protein